jgi:hypothetical protein
MLHILMAFFAVLGAYLHIALIHSSRVRILHCSFLRNTGHTRNKLLTLREMRPYLVTFAVSTVRGDDRDRGRSLGI